jgi:hypothetical protein
VIQRTRRFLACLSIGGFGVSTVGYLVSFFGVPVDKIVPWTVLLFVGWVAVFTPMYVQEFPAAMKWSFSWRMPRWVTRCSWILSAFVLLNFIWFALQFGLAVPDVKDGQYVLNRGGHILEVLTESEYLSLIKDELRLSASMMMFFYFTPMMYWCLWRSTNGEVTT